MKKNIITISREYGSGGREIGELAAKKLGYKFYDKELVTQIARETGLAEKFIAEAGEYTSSKSNFLNNFAAHAFDFNSSGSPSISDQLFLVQFNIIKDLADKGNCVLIGRCADYVLRDYDNVLNVFCHANLELREKRIIEVYKEASEKAKEKLADRDEKRKQYYKHYTDRQWGDMRNYHLTMDTGVIGIEKCADIIVDIIKM